MVDIQNNDLPDWMVFIGKWDETVNGHPLIYHLLDSAAVAKLLWQQALTHSARLQFVNWLHLPEESCGELLAFWTSLHDLGKATPTFQNKHMPTRLLLEKRDFDFSDPPKVDIRHHSLLSQIILIDYEQLLNIHPYGVFNQFRFAIGGHHGEFHTQEESVSEVNSIISTNLGGIRWKEARHALFQALTDLLKPPTLPELKLSQTDRNAFFNLLTGFFVTSDWISSQDELFQYQSPNLNLDEYWEKAQKDARSALKKTGWLEWQPDTISSDFFDLFEFHPYPLQQKIIQTANELHDPFLMIVEAPTGCGKTEAALVSADQVIQAHDLRGFYIAMPTQATSNQMFDRTKEFLGKRYKDQDHVNVQLIHGNAMINKDFQQIRLKAVEEDEATHEGTVNALDWFLPRKRSLLAPFGVGTVDQTFFSVLRTRHSFLRLFGLFRKVVIFDEVHAYDIYMTEIFRQLLAWLRAIGTSVIILSATLPQKTRLELLKAYQPSAQVETVQMDYPRISTNDGVQITAASLGIFADRIVALDWIDYDSTKWIHLLREKLANGGCAAVICNRVDRAQEVYQQIKEAGIVPKEDLYLLHARMPYCWRQEKENEIKERFGKLSKSQTEPRRGIVVATQIIEQSLDLDFDLLITDLAPIDLLIQRIGRLQRHSGGAAAPKRPDRLQTPLCLICEPETPQDDNLPFFDKDRYVYDEVILQRTFFTLMNRISLRLPSESDALINAVYSEQPLPMCSQAQNQKIQVLQRKMKAEQGSQIATARTRLVGDVDYSNALGGKSTYLKEEDQKAGEAVQALTRNNIQPSVQLVCFIVKDGYTCLLDEDYRLAPQDTPYRDAVEHALKSVVSVSKREVVDYFYKYQHHNAAWQKQPALRHAYPVIFENGESPLSGEMKLILDHEKGLIIQTSRS